MILVKCSVVRQHGISCSLEIVDPAFLKQWPIDKPLPTILGHFTNALRRQKLAPTDMVHVKLLPFSEKHPKILRGVIVTVIK